MWIVMLTAAALLVAYANGANDNFKGVATLLGSGTASYQRALRWATLTTFLGSTAAVYFATQLVTTFTGKGLVPDALAGHPDFLGAVALGAGLTVLLAAQFGIPVSTTHGLTGALAGAGFMAIGTDLRFETLGKNFFLPLLLSPVVSIVCTAFIYVLMHESRKSIGVRRETCLCVGTKVLPVSVLGLEGGRVLAAHQLEIPEIMLGSETDCKAGVMDAYRGKILGISAQRVLDFLHFLSAGAVSFARGLNDTPKIVALLTAQSAFGLRWNVAGVAFAMALGGVLGARRVAETMSHKITAMNDGQGFSANLVTAFLVIFASHGGIPVSTTHISCGALFGLGLVNGKARWDVIRSILGAWILTLPAAALLSAGSFVVLTRIGG